MEISPTLNFNLSNSKLGGSTPVIEKTEELEQFSQVQFSASLTSSVETYNPYSRAEKYKVQLINFAEGSRSKAQPPEYRYGNLSSLEDIDAFLTHEDRLTKEQADVLRTHIPSKDLLSVMDKMDDETLSQFVDVLSNSFNLNSVLGVGANKEKAQELISALNSMSEDDIQDTVSTLKALSEQESKDSDFGFYLTSSYHKDQKDMTFWSFSEAANYKTLANQKLHFGKVTHQYIELLTANRYSQGEVKSINQHLKESNFEQSRGILDMANHVKNNDRTAFLNMLDEVDKNSENNIFSYVNRLVDVDEYTSAYKSSEGGKVLFTDKMETESERREIYTSLLDAYEQQGVTWMEDVIEHVHEHPPQIQSEVWQAINQTVEDNPALFEKSDSVEMWIQMRLSSIQRGFENKQIDEIYDAAQSPDTPYDLGRLSWIKNEESDE
ncbi:hypothetical protein [Pseudoalteromonas luteoviolacea]|uniref:Uncharacterized protein n=1 Tax=Pseudoalteromonas luteoviolacea S4054 TaxID=1129367 RepID=A0A0F6AFB8_9GAMM|nr:hypothetical protein [Pseudoalteromonas luteoviolacea]AOT08115.1 hypothetical protein S4054249_09775 [Pseudoalteromonas luteoviolacea]AOT13032.1 hypothetical protein S40542_09775 [Pseudoalteromonas luteoviolacea]AOT17944.1 hypothetical protein S4054_09770 [Pseudoalteromonas luteoviolacea]KKE84501.1 hypothetical protein N479_08745 [Pseudoalteromonas luteoviolacea S4054]KZN69525.1 hypothetical protein N481_22295 [Pseudoalteromonas luteoviolacea S4047-1]